MATLRQRDLSSNPGGSVMNLDEWDALSSLEGRPSPAGDGPVKVAAGMKAVKRCLLVFATPNSGSTPKPPRRMLPKLSGLMAETYECVACMADIDVSEEQAIQVSCGHLYHPECLLQLVQVSMSSPTQFPPRCCRKPVSPLSFEHLLTPTQRDDYTMRQVEQSTPRRIYCANPRCSRFLGARDKRTPVRVYPCPATACGTLTCARCRIAVDPSPDAPVHACGHEPAHRAALRLGNTLGWVRCPECEQLVERDGGCSHMTCACGAHFCYGCGSKWQTCSCVEWRAGAGAGGENRRQRERDLFAPLQEDLDLNGRLALWAPPRPALPQRAQTVPLPPHDGTIHSRRRAQERRVLTLHHDESLEIVHEERGFHPLGRADSVRMSIFTVEEEPLPDFAGSCLPFWLESGILARGERARAARERGARRAATM
ncbi:hypothetical protein TRAPUB_6693 [Trametes pubescens]|uniref:RBR-type E3 ubiquitin transferase n=1 Tax=Trametes pubescens TaxID=154538 RepID=A0A1M2V5N6_TRAPU|nr:hypothetical protein TRAPUB_6693 [Trametes pubescens]